MGLIGLEILPVRGTLRISDGPRTSHVAPQDEGRQSAADTLAHGTAALCVQSAVQEKKGPC